MCGIAGIIAADIGFVSNETSKRIASTIRYRGRDDENSWSDGQTVLLLHSRLSIIDLQTGQQPMTDRSGRFVISFNGEIYNYKEIRLELEHGGATFRTTSDTEVILEGYKQRGPDICRALNGMFAFAIWDTLEKNLFLARDRLGKKPLFWTRLGEAMFFSSTTDSFRMIPNWNAEIAPSAVAIFSLFGCFPHESTMYRNAFTLPPASYAVVRPGQTTLQPVEYWRADYREKSRDSFNDLIDEYETILTDALSIRLRSDVPLALSYSAGVDSGTIAALCAKKLNANLRCYTIDYHTQQSPSEETINAESVARHLSLDWHYINYDYHANLLSELPAAYRNYDQPSNQVALVYLDKLFSVMKSHATVIISGNGADELFGGYNGEERFRLMDMVRTPFRWAHWFQPYVKSLTRLLAAQKKGLAGFAVLPVPEAARIYYTQRVASVATDAESSSKCMNEIERMIQRLTLEGVRTLCDFKMFKLLNYDSVDANFRLADLSGLSHQVEVRSPFLDYRMVEFAARLPHKYKFGSAFTYKKNKYLPRVCYQRYVPADIAWSRKKGMAWNVRYDLSMARDESWEQAFTLAYECCRNAGIGTDAFTAARKQYISDIHSGKTFSTHAGTMIAGFMIGMWLNRQP